MAQCTRCNKEVGCKCNLRSGLCVDCRKIVENTAPKITLTPVKVPKENK